jgi:hypothetical protein
MNLDRVPAPLADLARRLGLRRGLVRRLFPPGPRWIDWPEHPAGAPPITVIRHGLIVRPDMLPGDDGASINCPSLIKVPDWVPNPLGRYYLYFGCHDPRSANYIRLAYADVITGPYTIHPPGALRSADISFLRTAPGARTRGVMAPDAVVDAGKRWIVLYFSAQPPRPDAERLVFAAVSEDGLHFRLTGAEGFGEAYSRVFAHDGWHYAIFASRNQRVWRSRDGLSGFERGPQILYREDGERPYARHVAVQKAGDTLRVFYTRKRDAPERILLGTIDLRKPWRKWVVTGGRLVLRPELPWEGSEEPLEPSDDGPAKNPSNALRDPAICEDEGRTWLAYAVAGESGIAIAEVRF